MNEVGFVPGRRRPSLWRRLRRRGFRAIPVLVWIAGVGLVFWLLQIRTPVMAFRGVAEVVRYAVSAPSPGLLGSLVVRERALVESGQVLARLDDSALRLRLTQARHQLARLRAELDSQELRLGDDWRRQTLEWSVDRATEMRRLSRDCEQALLDSLETRAKLEEARIRREGVAIELARLTPLESQGLLAESELTRLDTEQKALAKRIAELEGILAERTARTRATRERLDSFVASQPITTTQPVVQLEPRRWQIRIQEVELEEIALAVSQLTLRAPAAGCVEEIRIKPGERLAMGQVLLTIVDPTVQNLLAYVPDHLRATVRIGMPAWVVCAASPGTVHQTRVLALAPALREIPVWLRTDPQLAERALAVYLEPTGQELPGETLQVRLDH